MKQTFTITKSMAAPPEKVFAALGDFANAPGRVPAIVRVEMLAAGPVGVGTKFKETRKMFGKEHTETLEVTAWEPSRRMEITGGSGGMRFRTEFLISNDTLGSRVDVIMDAVAQNLATKIIALLTGWFMKAHMKKCVAGDLDHIAKHVESAAV